MLRTALFIVATVVASAGAETVIVAGAGPSTAIVTLFFAKMPADGGDTFEVPSRSTKHAGGLSTADEGLFGRTGRPLTAEERGDTREEILLARIPLTFVADPDMGVATISLTQLEDIYRGTVTSWQDLGGVDAPIRLIGREPGEAAFSVLVGALPFMADAIYEKRLRRDHQVVTLLGTADRRGVLAFGAADNFEPGTILEVEGFAAGVAVGLVYNLRNAEHPLVTAAWEFAHSDAWRETLVTAGYLPVE